jgi:hypothetical protein
MYLLEYIIQLKFHVNVTLKLDIYIHIKHFYVCASENGCMVLSTE